MKKIYGLVTVIFLACSPMLHAFVLPPHMRQLTIENKTPEDIAIVAAGSKHDTSKNPFILKKARTKEGEKWLDRGKIELPAITDLRTLFRQLHFALVKDLNKEKYNYFEIIITIGGDLVSIIPTSSPSKFLYKYCANPEESKVGKETVVKCHEQGWKHSQKPTEYETTKEKGF